MLLLAGEKEGRSSKLRRKLPDSPQEAEALGAEDVADAVTVAGEPVTVIMVVAIDMSV